MNIRDLFVPFEDELQLLPSKRVAEPPLIEWRTAFGDLFFRIKGADPEITWCDLAYSVSSKRPLTAFKASKSRGVFPNVGKSACCIASCRLRTATIGAHHRMGRFW
jgi:hypothetical protein